MKNLFQILQASLRVIEFNNRSGFFPDSIISGDNFLSILTNQKDLPGIRKYIILDSSTFVRTIEKNSTDVIILNEPGLSQLKALQNNYNAIFFFERITILNLISIIYFFIKNTLSRRQKYNGLYYYKRGKQLYFYLGLKRWRPLRKRTRHYLSPLIKIEDFFQNLNDQNIKYSLLRWFEDLPEIQSNEDIDLLIEDYDLEKVQKTIDKQPGIIPFDIYSKTGIPGSDFQSLPYYSLSLAEKTLNETILYKNKFKVPTRENYFYLLAYHAVFHKGENSGLQCKKYKLQITNKPDHDYLDYLKQGAKEAQLKVDDFTLEGLHTLLELKGYAPPADTQYKLSSQNNYLKSYLADSHNRSEYLLKNKGLVCFIAREKIIEHGLLDELKKYIQKEGFTILKEKKIEEPYKIKFIQKVRGGNWNQGPWPVSGGFPEVIIVALDVYPVEPTADDMAKHPGITNKRIINKTEIRDFINQCLPDESKWFNGIHSSDNEIQAVEYLTLAGLDENEIYTEIAKHKKAFSTEYPVINVLSQYSKRAKVELISFNGKKAVKKTFKPMCERFLANEIEAYKLFNGKLPIPELLETGDNYIITSYIEGSKPLGYKIGINTLKKCLNILRQLYETGYSLLDFKPGNFLLDSNDNLYLIDFEFLYKYDVKPSFLNCYDLAGIPETLDHSLIPNNHIPKGTKQYDALWYRFTHVRYGELSELNNLTILLKSFQRYYLSRVNKLLSLINKKSREISKIIYRRLP